MIFSIYLRPVRELRAYNIDINGVNVCALMPLVETPLPITVASNLYFPAFGTMYELAVPFALRFVIPSFSPGAGWGVFLFLSQPNAGIGAPSHAAEAMEMGASACLVNTAIAVAGDPVAMAVAFKNAVEAGRMAYEAGLGAQSDMFVAEASSPLTAFLDEE